MNVVFSNPSSTTVLGTKTGHGLITGTVIVVSGCTQAYANSIWKITRVDSDTFTVDTALWELWNGVDVTGDVIAIIEPIQIITVKTEVVYYVEVNTNNLYEIIIYTKK